MSPDIITISWCRTSLLSAVITFFMLVMLDIIDNLNHSPFQNKQCLCNIGVGRGGEGGGGQGGKGGPTYPLAPPNNSSTFSFNFYVKQEKITKVPS